MNIDPWLLVLHKYSQDSIKCAWIYFMSYEEVSDFGNLIEEGKKCLIAGRWKPSIQKYEINLLIETSRNKSRLDLGDLKFYKTNNFTISERGKTRQIKAHHIRDRQLLKSFCTYELKPSIQNFILDSNSASQIGKGTEYAIKRFRSDLAHAYRKWKRDFYVVTGDFHDFFGQEDHMTILKSINLHDYRSYHILEDYLKCFPGSKGVGIGGEPSQDISVVYPSKLDRYLLCDKRVLRSGRYMDDFYFITHTKEDARNVLAKVRDISMKLKLTLNEKRTKINYMEKDTIIWLKKRTYLTTSGKIVMRLTRRNISDMKKRLYYYKAHNIDPDISMMCWCSYARPYNSRRAMMKIVKIYMDLFDVPWDRAKLLFRKHPTGFIESSPKLGTKEKRKQLRRIRDTRIGTYIIGKEIDYAFTDYARNC